MPRSRVRLVLAVVALLPICAILCVTYFLVIPFLTGFDPCLLTVLAPNDIAAIRTRYEGFYALIKAERYKEAYQYTSIRYREANDLEIFKLDTGQIYTGMWGTELTSESSVNVCGNSATLRVAKFYPGFGVGQFLGVTRSDGEWYFDWIAYGFD